MRRRTCSYVRHGGGECPTRRYSESPAGWWYCKQYQWPLRVATLSRHSQAQLLVHNLTALHSLQQCEQPLALQEWRQLLLTVTGTVIGQLLSRASLLQPQLPQPSLLALALAARRLRQLQQPRALNLNGTTETGDGLRFRHRPTAAAGAAVGGVGHTKTGVGRTAIVVRT